MKAGEDHPGKSWKYVQVSERVGMTNAMEIGTGSVLQES